MALGLTCLNHVHPTLRHDKEQDDDASAAPNATESIFDEAAADVPAACLREVPASDATAGKSAVTRRTRALLVFAPMPHASIPRATNS